MKEENERKKIANEMKPPIDFFLVFIIPMVLLWQALYS